MELSREHEEFFRQIARLGAQEALRTSARGSELGQEATLAGSLPLFVQESSLLVGGTFPVCGPCRSFTVPRCDSFVGVLRLWSYGGQDFKDVRPWPGLTISDLPIARVDLVVTTAGIGAAPVCVVMSSPIPHAFGPAREAEWEPFMLRGSGLGNAAPSLTFAAGFDVELLAAWLLLVNDATAANRLPHMNFFPPDAVATDAPFGTAWIDTAVTASQQAILQVVFGGGSSRQADTAVVIQRPAAASTVEQFMSQPVPLWCGRIEAAAASPNVDSIVSAGVAGDAVTIAIMGRRRRIR